MKKLSLLLLCILLGMHVGFAQQKTAADTIQAGWGTLNYAVPESPAFKILGTSPSNIMRPTATRDIALSIGNYALSEGATIPQNMAIEISPALFNPRMSLNDFKKNRFWYTSAFSIGTKVNKDKSYAIGLGLRIKLLDEQDLRTNDLLKNKFNEFGQAANTAYVNALKQVTRELRAKDKTTQLSYIEYQEQISIAYETDTAKRHKEVEKAINDVIAKSFDVSRISELRDSVKKVSWNKPVWDLGVATLFNSKDSLIRSIQPASKLGLWTTYGLPLFGQKGQLLIGVTGQIKDTLNSKLNLRTLNLGSRAYYGSNDLKGFIEGNAMFSSAQAAGYRAAIGIETTFFGGMWADFSLGITKQGGAKAVFTPGFSLSFANGEKKKSGS